MSKDDLERLSAAIEARLVAANPRGMLSLHEALPPAYCLRGALELRDARTVLIGTGFPVVGTFETDGPPGAIALYLALESLGIEAHIACAGALATALAKRFRVEELRAFDLVSGKAEARERLERIAPDVVLSIERPGLADDGRYYNMRGEDISQRCAVFDYHFDFATCPTIAIGDGGNEVGMGRLRTEISRLDIRGAATGCDELIVADVSNWGAYGLIAMLSCISDRPLLDVIDHHGTLAYLCGLGSVDGVTRENTPTEDGLPLEAGEALLEDLRELVVRFDAATREAAS
ncbi:MAG: glutamate cyclase domain-containing protein [Pseudomonadota bacterium]